jgi:23S rRNA (uracil1939-C5)-methyltransferase
MQHLRYRAQLALKQQQLLDELERSGVSATAVVPPRSGPQLGYRTKARLGVRVVGESVLAGFRETYSNRVARMESCEVLIPRFSQLVMPLRQVVGSLGRPDLIPQLELAAGDRDAAVVIRHLEPLGAVDIAMLEAFERSEGVRLFLQPGGYDSIAPLDDSRPPWLSYSNPDFGLHYRFLPWDFTQVNLSMNRRLVREALLHAGAPAPNSVLLDLFCGIGNFSLAAASLGWHVTGIEASEAAVARARLNAGLNGLGDRCEFLAADLYDPATDLPVKAECLILDPPRSGAGPNLGRWVEAVAPERIVYVSCQPATFASDAAVLTARGYRLERVGIFDMFPHTAHVETLGSFHRSW